MKKYIKEIEINITKNIEIIDLFNSELYDVQY